MLQRVILVVEDDENWQTLLKGFLAAIVDMLNPDSDVQVLFAETQHDARRLYRANEGNLCVIIMDGSVPKYHDSYRNVPAEMFTDDLIRDFAFHGCDGPIIGHSADEGRETAMRAAGCTEWMSKHDLSHRLKPLVLAALVGDQAEGEGGTTDGISE